MRLDEECRLSFYQQIASLNEDHGVYLVQNISDKKIYVKKILKIYNVEVFRYLKDNPIKNTPRIYEVIEDSNQLIVLEEYISGTTLQQILDEQKVLKEEQVENIIRQLCSILLELHKAHPPIIHRDIKPSNIIISPDGVVKLIDMNAAKWSRNHSGRDTALIGTVGYAAPEQYGFASSCAQTDIYSVGILVNMMLTGVLPQERLARGAWGEIINCCTKMDPQERYNSIDQVIAAIDHIQSRSKDAERGIKCRYAPPGFRTLNPLTMLFATGGYFLIILLGFSLTVENSAPTVLWLNRIWFTLIFMAIIFFFGNYMDIQEKMGICKIRNTLLRIMVKLFLGFNILIAGIILLAIFEQIIT